jgi:hypothetical protein
MLTADGIDRRRDCTGLQARAEVRAAERDGPWPGRRCGVEPAGLARDGGHDPRPVRAVRAEAQPARSAQNERRPARGGPLAAAAGAFPGATPHARRSCISAM